MKSSQLAPFWQGQQHTVTWHSLTEPHFHQFLCVGHNGMIPGTLGIEAANKEEIYITQKDLDTQLCMQVAVDYSNGYMMCIM